MARVIRCHLRVVFLIISSFLLLRLKSSSASTLSSSSSPERIIRVRGEIPMVVTLDKGAPAIVKSWLEHGGNTRIKIHVDYDDALGFPLEAQECAKRRKQEDPPEETLDDEDAGDNVNGNTTHRARVDVSDDSNDNILPYPRPIMSEWSPNENVRDAQIIFDWCQWEWSLSGRRGIWDSDFRFETYSLGLMILAETKINLRVNFSDAASIQDRSYFVDCLTKAKQLQEIARAIKFAMDQFIEEEEKKHEKDPPSPPPGILALSPFANASNSTSTNICQQRRPLMNVIHEESKKIGSGLNKKSLLCFKAIRPSESRRLKYLDTADDQETFPDTDYQIVDVCVCGLKNLSDSQKSGSKIGDGGLLRVVFVFRIIIMILVFMNLPYITSVLGPRNITLPAKIKYEEEKEDEGEEAEKKDDAEVGEVPLMNEVSPKLANGSDNITKTEKGSNDRKRNINVSLCLFNKDVDDDSDILDVDEDRLPEERFVSILDDSIPTSFGASLMTKLPCCGVLCNRLWEWARRFFGLLFLSTVVIFATAVLDRFNHDLTIKRLLMFKRANNVAVLDLRFWNYLSHGYWMNFHGFLLPVWIGCMLVLSCPKMALKILRYLEPSLTLGTIDLRKKNLIPSSFAEKGLNMKKVVQAMELRMGLCWRIPFWVAWVEGFTAENLTTKERIRNFVVNLIGIFTFFPITAPFIPWIKRLKILFTMNKKWSGSRLKLLCKLFLIMVLFIMCIYLMYETIWISTMFIIFTLTSIIFHYEQSLNLIGIIAGFLIFFLNVHSTSTKKYVSLKLIIRDVALDIHNEKMREAEKKKKKKENGSLICQVCSGRSDALISPEILNDPVDPDNSNEQVNVALSDAPVTKTLVMFSPDDGSPKVPSEIYKEIVNEIHPVGSEKVRIYFKLVLMAVFFFYIRTVMKALRMTDDGTSSPFDMAQAMVTVVAVVVPSILASITSGEEMELEKERRKCRVRKMMEEFIKNQGYYAS